MANNKKSFLFYCDWTDTFKGLSKEKGYDLLIHILDYVNDENPTTEDETINGIFSIIKNQLKRDLKKYEIIRGKRSEAGKISANKRKQKQQVSTSVESIQQTSTNPTVKDIVIDIVNVKVIDTYKEVLKHFPEHLHPKTENHKKDWLTTIKRLNEIDKIPFKKIIHIVKETRADDFWSKNFLSILKLRKRNKEGLMYVVVFNERLKKPEYKSIMQEIVNENL